MSEKKTMPWWQETLIMVLCALALAVVMKTFFIQAFYIPSESMEPAMIKNDKLLVEKVTSWWGDVERGDIIVFRDPGNWLDPSETSHADNFLEQGLATIGLFPTGGHLIKRVIGVGGDEVICCDDSGRTMVNGTAVTEPYVANQDANAQVEFHVEVPAGYVWVQGDNRGHSADSRAHMGEPGGGFIAEDLIVGRAWLRMWPMSRFGVIDGTDAFEGITP